MRSYKLSISYLNHLNIICSLISSWVWWTTNNKYLVSFSIISNLSHMKTLEFINLSPLSIFKLFQQSCLFQFVCCSIWMLGNYFKNMLRIVFLLKWFVRWWYSVNIFSLSKNISSLLLILINSCLHFKSLIVCLRFSDSSYLGSLSIIENVEIFLSKVFLCW